MTTPIPPLLVVDDENNMRLSLRTILGQDGYSVRTVESAEEALRLLEREGYRVLAAKDGIEAVEIFNRHKDEIALAVMDLGLPKLNGFDAGALTVRRLTPTGFIPANRQNSQKWPGNSIGAVVFRTV